MKIYNEIITRFNETTQQWETVYEDSFDHDGELMRMDASCCLPSNSPGNIIYSWQNYGQGSCGYENSCENGAQPYHTAYDMSCSDVLIQNGCSNNSCSVTHSCVCLGCEESDQGGGSTHNCLKINGRPLMLCPVGVITLIPDWRGFLFWIVPMKIIYILNLKVKNMEHYITQL